MEEYDAVIASDNDAVFKFYLKEDLIITIDKCGIKFNRELFPEASPNDFANMFIDILEKNFIVKFIEITSNGRGLNGNGMVSKYEG